MEMLSDGNFQMQEHGAGFLILFRDPQLNVTFYIRVPLHSDGANFAGEFIEQFDITPLSFQDAVEVLCTCLSMDAGGDFTAVNSSSAHGSHVSEAKASPHRSHNLCPWPKRCVTPQHSTPVKARSPGYRSARQKRNQGSNQLG